MSADSPVPTPPAYVRVPGWWDRRLAAWPRPAGTVPVPALLLAVLAGLTAALILIEDRRGVGLLLVTGLVLAATVPAGRATWRRRDATLWAGATLALTAVAALRDAAWVVSLCLVGAPFLGALAVAGGRSWPAVTSSWLAPPAGVVRLGSWLPSRNTVRRGTLVTVLRAAALAAVVLLAFVPLLASADAAFGRMLSAAIPDLQLGMLPARVVLFLLVTLSALGAALVAAFPPRWDALPGTPGERRRPALVEWATPLITLNVLFLAFVAVQATSLFGGRDYVDRVAGLTYAEYARRGFGQLLVTTVLTLVVVAIGAALAPRGTPRERRLTRAVLGGLCVLCLLIAGSALSRLALYEQEFGFTRARLFAGLLELALAAVLLMSFAAVVSGRGSWLPRAVVGCAVLTLLSLAAVNPDAYVARHNVDRYLQTGRIDGGYLGGLSADAIPELRRLPEPIRHDVLTCVYSRLPAAEPWSTANVSRIAARRAMAEDRIPGLVRCR